MTALFWQKKMCFYDFEQVASISVEESPSWLGKTTKKVWSFLTIPIKKLFVFNFILALFEKNVLLTPKIKNTNLVALESVESLYHNFGLQINNKNVPIFNWNLTADDKTLIPFFTSVFCRFCVNKVLLYAECNALRFLMKKEKFCLVDKLLLVL